MLGSADVVLVEGFKTGPQPKIEVCRPKLVTRVWLGEVPGVFAGVTGRRGQDEDGRRWVWTSAWKTGSMPRWRAGLKVTEAGADPDGWASSGPGFAHR